MCLRDGLRGGPFSTRRVRWCGHIFPAPLLAGAIWGISINFGSADGSKWIFDGNSVSQQPPIHDPR